MVLVNLSVIGVAVYQAFISQKDQPPAAAAQVFKQAIDSELADALKLARTSSNDGSSEIEDVPDRTFLNLLKPIASLHGLLPFDTSGIQEGKSTVRTWKTKDGLKKSEILNGMKYARGRIIVPESGTYRVTVHAMMHYEGSHGHCELVSLDVIRHDVITQKEDVIFPNKGETCPEAKEGTADHLSHVDGLVELNLGDQIYVTVSNLSLLNTYRDDHYFQVYLI
ncbi:tumor necrosis factor ligand superfamily member 6-like [Haliotis asinina]|uniref:tumor necrosis factor ligand superfamily member 6-like n=1 Tax=Haliotis asinina TaxID=109174 RepID=UPI00353216B5